MLAILLGIALDALYARVLVASGRLAFAVDPVVDGMRAQPVSMSRTVAAVSAAALIALVLYWWPSSRRYYVVIAVHERGIVPSFTS